MRLASILITLCLVFQGCFKEDITRPVITLKGTSAMDYPLGLEYEDPGFTATDNRDGDISRYVTVSGEVDITRTGIYQLHYNVVDASGNKAFERERIIYVKHHPGSVKGVFLSHDDCSAGDEYPTVIEELKNDEFAVSHILQLPDSFLLTGYTRGITGQGIVLNENTLGDTTYSGVGSISNTGHKLILQVYRTWAGFSDTCNVTLTR